LSKITVLSLHFEQFMPIKTIHQGIYARASYKKGMVFVLSCAIALGEFSFISPVIAQVKQDLSQPLTTEKSTQRSLPRRLKAIIRLAHTKLPPPTTTGTGRVSLEPLQDGIAWTMDVKIGDRLAKVLLDTGASLSMVSPDLTQSLGLTGKELPPEETRYAVAGDGCQKMKASIYPLPVIALGTAKATGLQTLQLSQAIIPENLAGILGMDLLSHFNFQIDPMRKELQLSPTSEPPKRDRNQAIPLVMQDGVALVKVTINGDLPFLFLIDTGAESTFISPEVASKLKLSSDSMKPIQVQGFCGLEPASYTSLTEVKVGDHALKNIESVVLQNTAVLDSLKVDGVLGQNFLNSFHQFWYFDHSSEQIKAYLVLMPLR
jgi:predicted aspartyl protease